jgi:DNA-binding transcriptional ArsR family regulator
MIEIDGCTILTITDDQSLRWVPLRQVCEALNKKSRFYLRMMLHEVKYLRVPRANGTKGWSQACIKEGQVPQLLQLLRRSRSLNQISFIESPTEGLVKISMTQDPEGHLKDLAIRYPVPLRLLKSIPGTFRQEAALHLLFEDHRSLGDWYHLPPIAAKIDSLESFDVPDQGTLPKPKLHRKKGSQEMIKDALASKTRQRIIHTLTISPLWVSQIVERTGLARNTVLYHLRKLLEAQVIQERRQGTKKFISLRVQYLSATNLKFIADWVSRPMITLSNFSFFRLLPPEEVLAYYDGPRTYTFHDLEGHLWLVSWLASGESSERYLLVPTTPVIVSALRENVLPLRDALDQPNMWKVECNPQGDILSIQSTLLSQIDPTCLPSPGVCLEPK